MSFDTLSPELQNIFLVNHSYNTKWFTFLVFIGLSIFYIFFIWKNHKPTKYIHIVLFRLFFIGLSYVYLLVSPMSIILMSPEYDFYSFYTLPFVIYTVGFSLYITSLFFEFGRFGILGMAKLGGLDVGDDGVNRFVKEWVNNKHLLKFKKKNKKVFK